MGIKSIFFIALMGITFFACSENEEHVGGSFSETQNAEVLLVDSKPALTRANANDTLRRWNFDIPDTDSTWTIQLSGNFQNSNLIDSWKAHLGNKFLSFDEKIFYPLTKFKGELVKSQIIENIDSTFIEIEIKLNSQTTPYILKSSIVKINVFEELTPGFGNLWQSTIDNSTPLFYSSCSRGIEETTTLACTQITNFCDKKMPIMCTTDRHPKRPLYNVDLDISIEGHAPEWSQGWSGYEFELGSHVYGYDITSKAVGDSICRAEFGSFSEWASDSLSRYIVGMNDLEYLDEDFANSTQQKQGGWGFYGYWKTSAPDFPTAFWVHRNKPLANCWWE